MRTVKVFNKNNVNLQNFIKGKRIKEIDYSINVPLFDNSIDIYFDDDSYFSVYALLRIIYRGQIILCSTDFYFTKNFIEDEKMSNKKNSLISESLKIANQLLKNEVVNELTINNLGDLVVTINSDIKIEIYFDVSENEKDFYTFFGSNKEYDVNNRFFSKELAGGALLDIGGYAVTFARLFLDMQPDVVLTTVKYFETGVDEQSGIILKNEKEQMAVIALTMRAKQPKRGVVTGDKGYIEVYDYPRADKAVIVDTISGQKTTIHEGDSRKALFYEAKAMEEAVTGMNPNHTLGVSKEVMDILTDVRMQWGMRYPFE